MIFTMLIFQLIFAVSCLFCRVDQTTFTLIIIISNVVTWARAIVEVRRKRERARIAEKERQERRRRAIANGQLSPDCVGTVEHYAERVMNA